MKNDIIEKLLELKEHYEKVRKNTHCRVTETDDCDSCRADHHLEAKLWAVDDCIRIIQSMNIK